MIHPISSGRALTGSRHAWLLALAAVALCAPSAPAVPFSVTSTVNGLPVTATANFTLSANQVIIDISGLMANPTSVAQALSGISFSLSGTGTPTGGAISPTLSTAPQVTVAGDKTFTTTGALPIPLSPIGWTGTFGGVANQISALGTAQPDFTILGGPGGATYANANSSIAGSAVHNPFLFQTAQFVLTYTGGVSANTTVSNVVFFFNTDGTPVAAVPEPATVTIAGIGMASMGLFRIFRRRNRSEVA
jgi:hypothetical protein